MLLSIGNRIISALDLLWPPDERAGATLCWRRLPGQTVDVPAGQAMTVTYPRMIARASRHEIEVRKSRFICSVDRVVSEDEGRLFVELVRKEFWNASHNCVAWSIGENGRSQRSNDDGEPAGTAGTPMLEVLRRRHLTNTAVVVTRFFGGVMLGAGGLVRAYARAVAETIDTTGIIERRPLTAVSIRLGHDRAGKFEHAVRSSGYSLGEVAYDGAGVKFSLTLEPATVAGFDDWVAEHSNGRSVVEVQGDTFVDIPVADST